jgi:acid-sensing ion channel, other
MQRQITKVKTRMKCSWRTARKLFFDYSKHSTIHGIKYIAEPNRSWFERVCWIAVIFVSLLCCGKLVMDAWNLNPIIISFTEKPTPIWKTPFPAVTICSKLLAQSKYINISDLYQRVFTGEEFDHELTDET